MKLKNTMTTQKLRGGFYTPTQISDFLTNWALENKGTSVLEPSCGDGVFLESILKNTNNHKIKEILAIEYKKNEANKAKKIVNQHTLLKKTCKIITGDFFKFYNQNLKNKQFDVILGNPPFVRYQYFENEQKDEAIKIMNSAGIKSNKLLNIWAPFLISCLMRLSDGGRLGMVLPAEMMHVNYSSDVRLFLSKFPAKISIITFKELIFPDVQQEIMLMLIERKNNFNQLQEQQFNSTINIIEVKNLNALKNYSFEYFSNLNYKPVEHTEDKWTRYFLSKQELKVLRHITDLQKLRRLGELATVDVGTVTGANKYFVISDETIKKFEFKKIALPLVGRSMHINGIIFEKNDWINNKQKGIASHLLNFPNIDYSKYPAKMKKYIKMGEKEGIHKGYKTGIRERWYQVPSIWKPDVFLLRRSHKFPKLILNKAKANTTDTMHRVKIKPGIDTNSLVFCFYNSITMAYSELVGRSHGGGVLEILPNDAETILIPYTKCKERDLKYIDKIFRTEKNIEKILDYVDDIVLKKHFKLSDETVTTFRKIWKKLAARRHERKKSNSIVSS